MTKLLYTASILVLLCFIHAVYAPVTVYAATPSINNVSGTIQTGQVITITGSDMVNENKASWDSFFTTHPNSYGFEGSSTSADGYCSIGPCGGAYDSNVKLMGSKSVKFHAQGFSSGPSDAIGAYNAFSSDGNDKWIRAYVRWNLISGGWPAIAIKMLYDLKGYYYEPSFSGNGGLPVNMLYKHDAASNQVPIPSGQLQNNRWYEVEVHWKKSSPPKFEAWIDNVQIVNVTPGTADPSLYVLFGMINIQGTQSNFSLDHWIDGLAVGTSRIYPASTIEISNSATYGSGTRVYQQPVYLSDGSVQIKVNLTGLGSGPYYLWITNNSQARSTAYQLTGGAPTAAAPLPPTITSIQ